MRNVKLIGYYILCIENLDILFFVCMLYELEFIFRGIILNNIIFLLENV